MTSWHGNAYRTTGPLWGESTGVFPSQQCGDLIFLFKNHGATGWLAIFERNLWSPMYSAHRGSVMWIFHVLLAWISCWTNSRVAGNFKRHDTHVTSLEHWVVKRRHNIDDLVQDCSISSALAMGILQSCTKLAIDLYLHFPSFLDIEVVEIPPQWRINHLT